MMLRFIFLFTLFGFCAIAQERMIIVKTDKKIDYKNLKVYEQDSSGLLDPSLMLNREFEKINNKSFSFFCTSTNLLLFFGEKVGYEIKHIENAKADTIVLRNLKLIPFTFLDTVYTTTTKYKADSTALPQQSTKRIYKNRDEKKLIPPVISINGIPLAGTKKIRPSNNQNYYCTPYKTAIYQNSVGRVVTFIYEVIP